MRYFLLLVMCLHGLIHLLGFVKAFGLAPVKELTLPISKGWGIFWLMVAVQFFFTAALYTAESRYWWISGGPAVICSQPLIIWFWKDARLGTVANLITCRIGCLFCLSFPSGNNPTGRTEDWTIFHARAFHRYGYYACRLTSAYGTLAATFRHRR